MKFSVASLAAFSAALLFSHAASAEDMSNRQDYLTFYSGSFDVLDDDNAAQLGMEYRAEPVWYHLVPVIGANVDTDGALYGYAGINYDLYVTDGFVITPNFMVGAYSEGDGKDLGGTLEFRSGIEAAFEFKDASRVGVAFNHISNASIYEHNPGAETLLLNYSLPLKKFF